MPHRFSWRHFGVRCAGCLLTCLVFSATSPERAFGGPRGALRQAFEVSTFPEVVAAVEAAQDGDTILFVAGGVYTYVPSLVTFDWEVSKSLIFRVAPGVGTVTLHMGQRAIFVKGQPGGTTQEWHGPIKIKSDAWGWYVFHAEDVYGDLNLTMYDVEAEGAGSNTPNFYHTGFRLTESHGYDVRATFTGCSAHDGGNDGFSANGGAGTCVVNLIDCEGHHNADEGASPHGTAILNIVGGHYYENGEHPVATGAGTGQMNISGAVLSAGASQTGSCCGFGGGGYGGTIENCVLHNASAVSGLTLMDVAPASGTIVVKDCVMSSEGAGALIRNRGGNVTFWDCRITASPAMNTPPYYQPIDTYAGAVTNLFRCTIDASAWSANTYDGVSVAYARDGAELNLEGCLILGPPLTTGESLYAAYFSSSSSGRLLHNTFVAPSESAMMGLYIKSDILVRGNIITGYSRGINAAGSYYLGDSGYNILYANDIDYIGDAGARPTDIQGDPQFVNAAAGDYRCDSLGPGAFADPVAAYQLSYWELTTWTQGDGTIERSPGPYEPEPIPPGQTGIDIGAYRSVNAPPVALMAIPDARWAFEGWVGAATGSENPVMVTLDGHKEVTAVFSRLLPAGDYWDFEYCLSTSGPAAAAQPNCESLFDSDDDSDVDLADYAVFSVLFISPEK